MSIKTERFRIKRERGNWNVYWDYTIVGRIEPMESKTLPWSFIPTYDPRSPHCFRRTLHDAKFRNLRRRLKNRAANFITFITLQGAKQCDEIESGGND